MKRVFIAVAMVAATLPLAVASADHVCDSTVVDVAGLYYVVADVPPTGHGSIWIYEESNGDPGLQRNDGSCETGNERPDTVVF
jgi:hypothetical protein